MPIDQVAQKLKRNLPEELDIASVYRDEIMGVYFIYSEIIDAKDCCFVHLHNIKKDSGTTYFFGEEEGFSMDLQKITSEQLFAAVGSEIFNDLLSLKNQ